MQQLIYVPPGGSYDDESSRVLLAAQDNYILSTLSGVGGVETTLISEQIAGMDGVHVQAVRAESREIPCTVYVKGKNRREMYQNRYELIKRLAAQSNPGTLYYSNDYTTVKISAYPTVPPDFSERIKNYNKCDIKFFAPVPYWSALETQTEAIAYAENVGFRFPLSFHPTISFGSKKSKIEINYKGSAPTPVQIVISGEAPSPTITNERTGEQIIFSDLSLGLNDELAISTERGNKRVLLTQGGTTSNAFHLIDAATVFWQLYPGRNVIAYSSADEGKHARVSISFSELYTGV